MPPKKINDYTLETMKDVCNKRFGKNHQLVITELLLMDNTASEKKIALIYNETGDRWVLYYQIQTAIYLFDPEGKFEDGNFDLGGFINANKLILEHGVYSLNFCRSWFVFSSYPTNSEYAKSGPVVVELAKVLMNLKPELIQVPMQLTKLPYLRLIERNSQVFGGGIKQFNLSETQLTPHLKNLLVTWPNLVVEDSSQREIALQAIERIDADENLADVVSSSDNTASSASQQSFRKRAIKSKARVVSSTEQDTPLSKLPSNADEIQGLQQKIQAQQEVYQKLAAQFELFKHESMTQVSKQQQEQQNISTIYQRQIGMLTIQTAEHQTQQARFEERYADETQQQKTAIEALNAELSLVKEHLKKQLADHQMQQAKFEERYADETQQQKTAFEALNAELSLVKKQLKKQLADHQMQQARFEERYAHETQQQKTAIEALNAELSLVKAQLKENKIQLTQNSLTVQNHEHRIPQINPQVPQVTIRTIELFEKRISKLEVGLKIQEARKLTQVAEIQNALFQLGEQSQEASVSNHQAFVQPELGSVDKSISVSQKRRKPVGNHDQNRHIKRPPPPILSSSSSAAGLFSSLTSQNLSSRSSGCSGPTENFANNSSVSPGDATGRVFSPFFFNDCLSELNAYDTTADDAKWSFLDDL